MCLMRLLPCLRQELVHFDNFQIVTHVMNFQAGLKAAYINRDGDPYPAFFTQPDGEYQSFESLADVLCNKA